MSSRWMILCLVLGMITAPLAVVGAQDEARLLDEHPLMAMLAFVPDIDAVRLAYPGEPAWVTFVDYRAALATDPNFPYPANFADYAAQVEQGRERWINTPSRIITEPALPFLWEGTGEGIDPATFSHTGPLVGEVMEALTGMDYFDIHTGMTVGRMPTYGLIFGGDLDLGAIGAAHMARGYTEDTVQGLCLWCSGKAGCEGAAMYDRQGIEAYNVFDSRFGRQPPFWGIEGTAANYIAGAFDYTLLLTMADAATGAHTSLAQAADYRTLAEALIDLERYSGDLIQAYVISGDVTSTPYNPTSYVLSTGVSVDAWLAPAEWSEYGLLPVYALMALADRQEGDDIVTMVALLYPDRADAERALPELAKRLTTYTGAIWWELDEPLLSSRPDHSAVRDAYVYTSAATGWSAAVVTLRSDFSYINEESGETLSNTNRLYSFYLKDMVAQGFYPLWAADFSDWQAWEN